MRTVEAILDAARWAPSGDNTQPWRFRIVDERRILVYAFDTRDHCVYDLDGHPSQLSVGALLETMRIAASAFGLAAAWRRLGDSSDEHPVIEVAFAPDASVTPSPLIDAIRTRCVQRRPMRRRPLARDEIAQLESSLPAGYGLLLLAGRKRWTVARLLFTSANIRLTTREAFEVHARVIEWNARFSEERIPDQAVGLDPLTTRLMRWAMRDWRRVRLLNTFFAGTVLPRLQLDFVPALACAAHALILAPTPPRTVDDYLAAGGAVQRFWLTATRLGLQHQPEITPLIFRRYASEGRAFTESGRARRIALAIGPRLEHLVGKDAARRAVWMGRIGAGRPATARSLRLPLEKLLVAEAKEKRAMVSPSPFESLE